jgi:aminopeptidase N
VLDEELARERGRVIDSVNVHEMAHSYFGNQVVCRDFAHAWLKESWATYMEQCWLEDAHGSDEACYQYFRNLNAYIKESESRYQRPIVLRSFRSSWDMYDQHLYAGGACRLHMLRHKLGDEIFWPAVCQYLNHFAGKTVETADFRRVLEAESGHSLVEFFEQWFYRPGYPQIEVEFEYDIAAREGRFVIEQTGSTAGVADSAPFRFATRLGWTLEGKEYSKAIEIVDTRTEIAIKLESEPEIVRFDPDNALVHKLEFDPGVKRSMRQLEAAPDVAGRIQAAQALMGKGNTKYVAAVIDALLKERFWGVRVEIAGLLGQAHTDTALNGLIDAIYREKDPRVLEAIVESCSSYIDQRIRDTLIDRLEHGLPYRARAAAYRALGAQRELAPWQLLLEACARLDHSGLIQGSAFLGLALTRNREALSVLLDVLAEGKAPANTYLHLIRAIGDIGSVSDRSDRERALKGLEPLLRVHNHKIKRAAAAALLDMRAWESRQKLEAYRAVLPHQEQVKLDRRMKRMDSKDDEALSLRRQLEDLRLKFRSLERRVERLEGD